MSYSDDLDWLARNVHKWVSNELLRMKPCDKGDGTFRASWCYSGDGGFTKEQWLARRAELQNKPSWESSPEWARWMAQSPNGHWEFFSVKPVAADWWTHPRDAKAKANDASRTGIIIGDWRDTLERRPEKFQPFTSIEDNQEKVMKQDNGWFERGELPPVGTECERRAESGNGFYRVFVVGHGEMLGIKVGFYARSHNADSFNCSPSACFRPIRTDRDEAIEVMKAHCPYPGSWETAYRLFAESLYDAGYRAGGSE